MNLRCFMLGKLNLPPVHTPSSDLVNCITTLPCFPPVLCVKFIDCSRPDVSSFALIPYAFIRFGELHHYASMLPSSPLREVH